MSSSLLEFAPMEIETNLGANEPFRFLKYTLEQYGETLEAVVAEVNDFLTWQVVKATE